MSTPRFVRLFPLGLFLASALAIAPAAPVRETPAGIAPSPRQPEGDSPEKKADEEKADEKLTLERIFPEKSYWGPSARSVDFSHDGRFAAFLYQPYAERRHGMDLYIHDTTTGQTRRITSVSRFAEYQAEAREVRDDREKLAKGAGITLAQLAREQAEQLGWPRETPAGAWQGQATTGDAEPAIRPGECRLTLEESSEGKLGGELRVGLVRLPLTEVEFDSGDSTLEAEVEDKALKVEGELEAAFDAAAGTLVGTVVFESPAQTLAFTLDAAEPEVEDDAEHEPRGVLGAIGERLTLADVVLDTDAEINDEKDGKAPDKPAPRYGGVQGYEWSKVADEMLVIADGDIYRLVIDAAKWDAPIERPAPEAATEPDPAAEGAEPAEPGEADAADDGHAEDGDVDEGGDVDEVDVEDEDDVNDGDVEDGDVDDDETGDGDADDAENADEDDEGDDDNAKKKSPRPESKPVIPYRGDLERLTRTRERESDVQYLPGGSGYTYLRGGALLRVSFGDHRIVQLDPELKDGEQMVGYAISPDQKRLVFLANRGGNFWGAGTQVTIVNYRERFARAEQVTRHMPDDPWPEAYSSVYLYDLRGHDTEEGTLERVFTKRVTGPRDILRVPEWSPDSSRVAFAAFEQSTGLIKILEAGFVDEKKKEEAEAPEAEAPEEPAAEGDDSDGEGLTDSGDGEVQAEAPAAPAEEEPEPEFKIENAEVVYEFFHFGGPNTPGMVHPYYLPDSRRLAFIAELSGFRQLHLLDPRYQQLTQLTTGNYEVYPFDISEDHSTMFVTATKEDPNQEHVYAVNTETGAMTRLTPGEGVYSGAGVSDDASHLLTGFTDFGSPRELVAITTGENGSTTVLTDSHPAEAHKLSTVAPEYFTYENRHGQTIHGHMFKPKDWTSDDKRPLLLYVYGGPLGETKMATRGSFAAPSYFFARYMAENHGYVTATIDPRGASGYGAVFEKANFEQVGKPQTEDLVDGARWLVKHAGVDEKRMGLHGWSFGGFQTQMVMYTEPDVFAVGMAGAGPTEWFNYNSWYTTGTIGPHEPGKLNLKEHSLLPLAKNLKGRLLLIHGMEDSNVLYQDTVNVYRELLKAGKEVNVELFLDPTGNHGLGGDVKTIGRYRKYEDFLVRYLGEGEAAPTPEPAAEVPVAEPEPDPKPEGDAEVDVEVDAGEG